MYPHNRISLFSPARLAAFTWLVLAVALLAASILASPALGLQAPAQTSAASFEDEAFEAEEEGEWEEDESEWEEDDEEIGAEGPLILPLECLLHSAEAEVTASTVHNVVHLTIHYTSTTPTNVTVDYWLKGGKGSLQFEEAKRHFGQQGVFREDAHLSDREMAKVRAARTFIVQLDIPAAPAYCARYATQRLTAKHVASNRATWSRPS